MNEYIKSVLQESYKTVAPFTAWATNSISGDDCTHKRAKPAPFLKLLSCINQKYPFKTIVEIGAIRYAVTQKCIDYFNLDYHTIEGPACCADGHSTYFLSKFGGDFYSVDIDPSRIDAIKNSYHHLNEKQPDNLHVNIPCDGIDFLKTIDRKIDLLFLDGWDVGTPSYAENHLLAYTVAKVFNKLSDNVIIGIDDTDFTPGFAGKDNLLGPELIKDGFVPFLRGRCSLFIKL